MFPNEGLTLPDEGAKVSAPPPRAPPVRRMCVNLRPCETTFSSGCLDVINAVINKARLHIIEGL